MAEPIKHGERLPVVGGPYCGELLEAFRMQSFMGGGLAPTATRDRHRYRLDILNRRWVYDGVISQQQKESDHG